MGSIDQNWYFISLNKVLISSTSWNLLSCFSSSRPDLTWKKVIFISLSSTSLASSSSSLSPCWWYVSLACWGAKTCICATSLKNNFFLGKPRFFYILYLSIKNLHGNNPLSGRMCGWLCWAVMIPWKCHQLCVL